MFEAEYLIFCQAVDHTPHGTNIVALFQFLEAPTYPTMFGTRLVEVMLRAKKPLYGESIETEIKVEKDGATISHDKRVLSDVKVLKDAHIPIDIDFPNLIFEEPGMYHFKFYVEGRLLITRPLRLRQPEN